MPSSYEFRINGELKRVAASDSIVVADLPNGDHEVMIDSLPENCAGLVVQQTVSVAAGGDGIARFAFACRSLAGSIEVSTVTSGVELPARRFVVVVDGSFADSIGIASTLRRDSVRIGTHTVTLRTLANNCVVTDSSRTVNVQFERVTVVPFEVRCTRVPRVVFMALVDGNADIYTMNLSGGEVRRLTTEASYEASPSWSPDGNRIAFVSDRGGRSSLYVMELDGSGVRMVADSAFTIGTDWSRATDRIAYVFGGNGGIASIRPDGSGRTTHVGGWTYNPSLSPNGIALAYERRFDIDIFGPDGGVIAVIWGTNVTFVSGTYVRVLGETASQAPRLSPSGALVTYRNRLVSEWGVFVADTLTPGATRVYSSATAEQVSFDWLPDGSQLFISDGGRLYFVRPDGTGLTQSGEAPTGLRPQKLRVRP